MIGGKIGNGLERGFVKHGLNYLLITNPKCLFWVDSCKLVQTKRNIKTFCNLYLYIPFSYHNFKIKGLESTPVKIIHESGNMDNFSLQCELLSVDEILVKLLDIVLTSKSAKQAYTLRDVADELLKEDIIEEVPSGPTEWVSPRVVVQDPIEDIII